MNNKEALRHFLKWRRQLIDPVELGWPKRTGRGRRAPGLSQAQVAQALYVSERTYGDLERGESRPGPEFLDNVASVLRMDEREREALYVYALGHEPPASLDPAAGTTVAPAWQRAVSQVSGQASYVNDVSWNILAYNEEFVRMFPQRTAEEPRLPERNMMRWMLLREEAREHHLVDWRARWAGPVAAQLRAAVAAYPENEGLQLLDHEVSEDPVVGPIYRDPALAYVQPDGDSLPLRHAGYEAPQDSRDLRTRCCDGHVPSQLGAVTMCAAAPLGSPGARIFLLPFSARGSR
ncbi:transcriptional regulator [Streptomyces clavuligerus]|nr:transcriptional regulator [Streptomyces clavuligerus]